MYRVCLYHLNQLLLISEQFSTLDDAEDRARAVMASGNCSWRPRDNRICGKAAAWSDGWNSILAIEPIPPGGKEAT